MQLNNYFIYQEWNGSLRLAAFFAFVSNQKEKFENAEHKEEVEKKSKRKIRTFNSGDTDDDSEHESPGAII